MVKDAKQTGEESRADRNTDFGNIDKELGEIPKDRDLLEAGADHTLKAKDHKFRYLKNVLFVLLLAATGLALFAASFKGGQKIFMVYKTMVQDSSPEGAVRKGKETPSLPAERKVDKQGEGEIIKSGARESVPVKNGEPALDRTEKANPPILEKQFVPPVKIDEAPVAKTEKPAKAAKPKLAAPDADMPARNPSVKPAANEEKPAEHKKASAANISKTQKKYKVIVGSYSIKGNADILVGELKANHFTPMIVQTQTPKGELYRVIVGSYRSLGAAKKRIGELKKAGFQSFYILE